MKPTTLARNSVSTETVDLISRLVDLIPWAERRQAMGDVTLSLLNGKHRVAETVFGWNRFTVAVGINEFQTDIACINDLSTRLNPKLLADIHAIMEPPRSTKYKNPQVIRLSGFFYSGKSTSKTTVSSSFIILLFLLPCPRLNNR